MTKSFYFSVKCTNIPSPDNGTSVLSSDGLKTSVTITCIQGYSLTGESQLTCEDGNWSQAVPSCGRIGAVCCFVYIFLQIASRKHVISSNFEPQYYMSRIVRKPDFCLCENKGADQLRGNREADQRLCFRYTDSIFPLLLISEISSF